MSEKPAPAPEAAAPAAAPAPAEAPAKADKQALLRGFAARINAGEFDPGAKDYHQFVVKEIYPLLNDGTLTVDDLTRLTEIYGARNDPNRKTVF